MTGQHREHRGRSRVPLSGAHTAAGDCVARDARAAVARLFEDWLAERHPGTRWIVERGEGDERSGVAAGAREVVGQVAGQQDTRSVA
jgi:hypothetical protein